MYYTKVIATLLCLLATHAEAASKLGINEWLQQQVGHFSETPNCQFTRPAIKRGSTRLPLAMYAIGQEQQKVAAPTISFEVYQQQACKQVVIEVPQQQAYWDESKHPWVGPIVCQDQEVSSHQELRRFIQNGKPLNHVYLLNNLSCGSLGCSYQLTIGNITPQSLDICH